MSSSPSVLKSSGLLELAVKYSSWAPANWVHTQCAVGDWVTLRSTSWQTFKQTSTPLILHYSDLAVTSTTRWMI